MESPGFSREEDVKTTAAELSDITGQPVARAAVVRCLALVQEMLQGAVESQSGSLEDLRCLARDLGGAAHLASVVGLAAVAEVDRRASRPTVATPVQKR